MKKTNFILLAFTALATTACHFESFDERCERETREYTQKQCPRRLDEYTIMDSTVYDTPTRTITYYYTFEKALDDANQLTEDIKGKFREQLCKNVINSIELKAYKEKELNFRYLYHSQTTGKVLFETVITPEDYGKGKFRSSEE